MKILVISLACLRKSWRQKFVFASRNPDMTFKIIVPHRWTYYYYPPVYEKDSSSLDVVPCRVAFPGRLGRHFYYSGLLKIIKGFRPDIIHIEHEPESLVTLEVVLFRNLFLPQAKIILSTSRTFEAHLRWGKIRKLMERYIYKEIDYISCVSQRSHDFLKQQGYRGHIKVHPNGVDLLLFTARDVTSLRNKLGIGGSNVIGYAGRLVREKGVDLLVKAAAKLRGDYKLLVVGDGPELSRLQMIARNENFDGRLIIAGLVREEDMPQYINCMDVVVLPSITTDYWEEYFGMILIEAIACGVPVVGSTCGGIPDVICEKRLIFQEGEVDDLKNKLTDLFQNYDYWKRWAEERRAAIKANYNWEALGQQLVEIYNEVLA